MWKAQGGRRNWQDRGFDPHAAFRNLHAAISTGGILLLMLFLTMLQPAYANGGHMHLGGIFFLLLGGLIFIGGFVVVCYLLFRAEPEATREESDDA